MLTTPQIEEALHDSVGDFERFADLLKAKVNPNNEEVRVPELGAYLQPKNANDPVGINRKFVSISYDMLRVIADRVPLINAIHNLRCAQMRPFTVPSTDENTPGFKVKIKDEDRAPTPEEEKACRYIENWFAGTGRVFSDEEEEDEAISRDSFADFMERTTRDALCIDQVAVELRRDQSGRVVDFWALDGATIYPVNPLTGYRGDKKIKYVQLIKEQPVAEFERGEILFDCMNKRTDLQYRPFGYSYLEQSIETVTAFIYALAYNKEQFSTGSQPKGFITFSPKTAHLDQTTLDELARNWHSMFQGIRGQWKTPFLQHDAKWVPIHQSNKDMEFNVYIQTLSAYMCAVYKVDPAELGLKFDKSTALIGENVEAKLVYSKDRGVADLLSFFTNVCNKIIKQQKGWEGFEFTFTGVENRNQKDEVDLEKVQSEYMMTVNEIRAQHDMKPIKEGDIILSPTYVQYIQQKEQAEQQKQQENAQAMMGGGGEGGEEGEKGGPEGMLAGLQGLSEKDTGKAAEQGVKAGAKAKEEATEKSAKDEYVVIEW